MAPLGTDIDSMTHSFAIIALQDWVFEPARENGRPVEARVTQVFSYQF